jgi:spore germination protein
MRRVAAVVLIAGMAAPALAYRFSAWIPTWDPAALETMQRNAGNLDESNPSWYTIAPDGGIVKNWNAEAPELRAALIGTLLVPTIKNYIGGRFDPDVMATMLGSSETRERHAEAIVQLTVNQALDGIDLDYEAMRSADRESFSLFVELLGAKLHGAGKILSVTVQAKTSAAAVWDGPGAQDWARIGAAADFVKVMAYDKHWSGSAPGPIAPLDWLASVARYATSVIPAEKIVIGLPWYGYDWGTAGGNGVTWKEAVELARSTGASVERDANGEATFRYGQNVVFYQDGESYRRKIDSLAAQFPAIGGFAHWRAGGEDPEIWREIERRRGTGGAPAERPAGSFLIDSPTTLALRAGEHAGATIGIIPVDGFDAAVAAKIEPIDAFDGSALLSDAEIRVGKPATLLVAASRDARPGIYRLRLTLDGATVRAVAEISVEIAGGRARAVRR